MSVFQDSNRHLWISADNEGLYELGIDGRRLRHYHPDYSENSVPNVVMCIYEDTDYNLWIALMAKDWLNWIKLQGNVSISNR